MLEMKVCSWCGRPRAMCEEGSFEVDPVDETTEIGWVCDHCIYRFDNECSCPLCSRYCEAAK